MSSPTQAASWLNAALALPVWLLLVSPRPAVGQSVSVRSQDRASGTHTGQTTTVQDGVLRPRDDASRASREVARGPTFSVARGATSQAVLEPLPPVDAAVIFDDFRYVAPVDYNSANKSGPTNSVFGPNRWLVGPDVDHLGLGDATRAWYGFEWQDEYVDYTSLPCPATRPAVSCPPDHTLYDEEGTEIDTEPVYEAPGHAVMRFHPGDYNTGRLVSPLLTSGFAARTGTWVVRVRLPAFDRLDDGNGKLGVLLAPLWLKSADETWDARGGLAMNGSERNWWEANIEIWRAPRAWGNYAGGAYYEGVPEADLYLSAGNSWWKYSSAQYEVDRDSIAYANATFGPCTVVHRSVASPSGRESSSVDQTACLDAMIGTPTPGYESLFAGLGHPYVYFMMQHTGEQTRRYVYVRREDDRGRPTSSSGFESLLLDQVQSNYVDPGFFSAQLQMILFPTDPVRTTGTVGDQSIDMLFDWFLYTPDTNLTVREAPDFARAVQRRLSAYNRGRPAREQVWRVNTTDLALGAPRREVSPWATCNPWRTEPTKNWDFEVEKTDRNGTTYFTVQSVRDSSYDLRRMFHSVEWNVAGGRFAHTVSDEGYTLERGDWGSSAQFDITATVTQTSPVVGDSVWVSGRSTECPDRFGPATRRHVYRYNPVQGLFYEVLPLGPGRQRPTGETRPPGGSTSAPPP